MAQLSILVILVPLTLLMFGGLIMVLTIVLPYVVIRAAYEAAAESIEEVFE